MFARSSSFLSLTTSLAVIPADGSIRMSSGASAAYEKPRSGRSSCIDETPRSSRITSAFTPFEASCSSTWENSPWSSRAFAAVERRRRSKYGVTLGSRSIAISLPSPRSCEASRPAWPPAPKVQSTIVSPGRGASVASTSSARTGTWSVSVGKTLGNIFCAPFDCLLLFAPGGAIPDLEVVVDACDSDFAADACDLEQGGRDHHAPLLVELRVRARGEEPALHRSRLTAERVERADAVGKPRPLRLRVDVETAVEAAADDDPFAKLLPELRRKREAVLVVERVFMFAEEHRSPRCPTLTHRIPLVQPSRTEICAVRGVACDAVCRS